LRRAATADLGSGVEYVLDKLPDGFALFEIPAPKAGQGYKRLFGHHSGQYYDSCPRFQPHFIWLMSGMEGNCECIRCDHYKRSGPIIPRNRHPVTSAPSRMTEGKMNRMYPRRSADRESSSDPPQGRAGGMASRRPQRQLRAAGALYATDPEGTEDVYKTKLKMLETMSDSRKGIEDDIFEPNSIDWRAEHSWRANNAQAWAGSDLVQRTITSIEHQHSFIPRVGELVMFFFDFLDGHFLILDESNQEHKFYSFERECFNGFPKWRAGVVAEIPSATAADGPVDFPDIQTLPKKHNNLNTGGFRIETIPDPNNAEDKSISKQYRYLPLRNIRPFSQYRVLLNGIPRPTWHPSIEHALTVMTSISLVEKFDFKGDWPNANIRCKGVFIGSELITIGDTVRIMPEKPSEPCTDVLVVESIRLHLRNIQHEHVQPDHPLLATRMYITLVGKAYTLDPQHRGMELKGLDPVTAETAKTLFRPVGTILYGTWYSCHGAHKRLEISHDQVLGRLYEAAAVQLWTSSLQRKPISGAILPKPSLDFDLSAIQAARAYATQADERLAEAEPGKILWFWADTRAEALDLQTLNGIDVGRYDKIRDKETLEMWRHYLRVLDGNQTTTDSISSKYTNFANLDHVFGKKRGRPAGSKIVNGKLVKPGDPGYAEVADEVDEPVPQMTPSKHKTSQMAGAALVSTDESGDDGMEYEDAQQQWGMANDGGPAVMPGRPLQSTSTAQSIRSSPAPASLPRRSPAPVPVVERKPKTKQEIMANAVDSDGYSSSEDLDWDNVQRIRGGTEESEGGDYDPQAEY
jgi:hypothetical protein